MSDTIKRITIEGFKSIRKLESFELRPLNVLIGANGAGKTNFVEFFRLLRELVEQRLQLAVGKLGGADACLYMGPKITRRLVGKLDFGTNGYELALVPTADNRLIFDRERAVYHQGGLTGETYLPGSFEASLKDHRMQVIRARNAGSPSTPTAQFQAGSSITSTIRAPRQAFAGREP